MFTEFRSGDLCRGINTGNLYILRYRQDAVRWIVRGLSDGKRYIITKNSLFVEWRPVFTEGEQVECPDGLMRTIEHLNYEDRTYVMQDGKWYTTNELLSGKPREQLTPSDLYVLLERWAEYRDPNDYEAIAKMVYGR